MSKFTLATTSVIAKMTSDHTPMHLTTGELRDRMSKIFRFEK